MKAVDLFKSIVKRASRERRLKICLALSLCLAIGLVILGCRKDPFLNLGELDLGVYNPKPYDLKVSDRVKNLIKENPSNPMTEQGVMLGRMLFYDPILSVDSTVACSNCHNQQHAFTDPSAISTGVHGRQGIRNSMPLMNLMWVPRLFWDGRATSLEHQVTFPIQDTLEMVETFEHVITKLQRRPGYPSRFYQAFGDSTVSQVAISYALAQFIRSLVSFNAPIDLSKGRWVPWVAATYGTESPQYKGLLMFMHNPDPVKTSGECDHCHSVNDFFTDNSFRNNGLNRVFSDLGRGGITGESVDMGHFRTPTLRNIEVTAPYMHDGRFNTLREVLDHYSEHIQPSNTIDPIITTFGPDGGFKLSEEDKDNILAFLALLTDPSFLTDKRFSNPHVN
jgi:cytochrome c peroxidase